jgi:hypothetical protein
MDTNKIKEIFDGWKNDLFRTPEIEALAKERAEVCASCEHNIENKCNLCGCPLSKKTRSETTNCPDNRWKK